MKFLKKIKKNTTKNSTHKVELGTLYNANKNLVEKGISPLTEEELNNKKELITNFVQEKNNKYYMLLCNDRKDYTVFTRTKSHSVNENTQDIEWDWTNPVSELANILIDECLLNRGTTKSIELTENKDAIEIWISIDEESYCYYFFPYDAAIINC